MDSNNDNLLNMDQFRKKHQQIKNINHNTFESIYKLIIENIKNCASNSEEFCFYEVPLFIFGEPLYTKNEIITYLTDKLNKEIEKKNLKQITFIDPNILFIEWSLEYD